MKPIQAELRLGGTFHGVGPLSLESRSSSVWLRPDALARCPRLNVSRHLPQRVSGILCAFGLIVFAVEGRGFERVFETPTLHAAFESSIERTTRGARATGWP